MKKEPGTTNQVVGSLKDQIQSLKKNLIDNWNRWGEDMPWSVIREHEQKLSMYRTLLRRLSGSEEEK